MLNDFMAILLKYNLTVSQHFQLTYLKQLIY